MADPQGAQAQQAPASHAASTATQRTQRTQDEHDDFDLPAEPRAPGVLARALATVKAWFSTGNVPVKVGMLVLLAGVAALLRYASTQGWINAPMWLRLSGLGLVALLGLAFGWQQREKKPAFAQALQGGALGVLLLTVFAAYKLYGLMGPGMAFGVSAALIAGVAIMATRQNALSLAMLSVGAGFLAPIWLSSGSGNHVALFSYYALLNAGIVAIAWLRPWRVLMLMGWAFTWVVGIAWGVLGYTPAKFASTEPFLLLFFAFYLVLPILYARKAPAQAGDRINGCLLFGTPLVAYSLQAVLLEGARMPLAAWALGLAVVYGALAKWGWARPRLAALARVHAVLGVGFATLAVPLALSAGSTAMVFALEGLGLVWLGLRQQRKLPQVSGWVLQLLAALAFAMVSVGANAWPVLNPGTLSALTIAAVGWGMAWLYHIQYRVDIKKIPAAGIAYLWGMLWWLFALGTEIGRVLPPDWQLPATIMATGFTAAMAAGFNLRWPNLALALTALAGLCLGLPLAMGHWELGNRMPLAGAGLIAWAVFLLLAVFSLRALRKTSPQIAGWAQLAYALLWPLLLCLSVHRWDMSWGEGWHLAAIALPWLLATALSLWRWSALRWPVGAPTDAHRTLLQAVLFGVLGAWWLVALCWPGDTQPVPWLPVLNPLDLAQTAVLLMAAVWLWQPQAPAVMRPVRVGLLAGLALLAVTVFDLRAMHHLAGVRWDIGMLRDTGVQTSLTLLWSVLGVFGWVLGSRRGNRVLWLAGAGLMGVVLLKLLIVDRQNLGDLLGIGAFIAYGLLCTLVGWLAPAPPSAKSPPSEPDAVPR